MQALQLRFVPPNPAPVLPIGGVTLIPADWNHLAITSDGSTVQFYLNGAAATPLPAVPIQLDFLRLGNNSGGTLPFAGRIDEIHVFDHPLAPIEIQQLHLASVHTCDRLLPSGPTCGSGPVQCSGRTLATDRERVSSMT
jgi:hypothetical protein